MVRRGGEADPTKLAVGKVLAPLGWRAMELKEAIEQAEASEDWPAALHWWTDAGDSLANAGRAEQAAEAWRRGVAAAERVGNAARRQVSSLYWRLGQVAEATRALTDAEGWYERAADAFHSDQATADEAVARMALARVRFHQQGGGLAASSAREAVLAAKAAGDQALMAEALELSSEIAFDLGEFEDAQSRAREAAHLHRELHDAQGEVRATITLAEAMLEGGLVIQAVNVLEPLVPLLESVESPETRGRGLALLARFQMETGKLDESTELLTKAQEYLANAGASLRRARLLVAFAQRMERQVNTPVPALELYKTAWDVARHTGDRFRIAPIGYAYARAMFEIGDSIGCDTLLQTVLTMTREANDLQGLVHATELGVRVAVKLGQGPMALDRLLSLARTRARLGDVRGELRTLLAALEAAIRVPDLDPVPLAEEFMECVRRTGTEHLGPGEAMAIAKRLYDADRPALASELAMIQALQSEHANQLSVAARTFAQAAFWALVAGKNDDGLALYERALALGEPLALAEVGNWVSERNLLLEQ